MLKELPNRFELNPNALEIGDRFFCIDRSFIVLRRKTSGFSSEI